MDEIGYAVRGFLYCKRVSKSPRFLYRGAGAGPRYVCMYTGWYGVGSTFLYIYRVYGRGGSLHISNCNSCEDCEDCDFLD